MCTGTLALLRQRGWQMHIATAAPGDCGTVQYSREEISRIRKGEAAKSAAMLDGQVPLPGVRRHLHPVRPAARCSRPSRSCEESGRESSSRRVPRTTWSITKWPASWPRPRAFAAGSSTSRRRGPSRSSRFPHLYYMDAVEGKDKLGTRIEPSMIVDISSVMDTKEKMLCLPREPAGLAAQASWDGRVHQHDEGVLDQARRADRPAVRRRVPPASRPRLSAGQHPPEGTRRPGSHDVRRSLMARKTSILAPEWWDYTTLDDEILNDAAKLTVEDMAALSREGFRVVFYDTLEDFYLAEALEYITAWKQATLSEPAGICGPIGPTEQLPLVARLVNELELDLTPCPLLGHGRVVHERPRGPPDPPAVVCAGRPRAVLRPHRAGPENAREQSPFPQGRHLSVHQELGRRPLRGHAGRPGRHQALGLQRPARGGKASTKTIRRRRRSIASSRRAWWTCTR